MVRVRFAPSPTGFLHIGGLRTALYNYLFAQKNKGTFILRIEDTDVTRFVPRALENLLSTLKWIGINYDEGPEKAGPYEPYIQSQRTEVYKKHAQILLDTGAAYHCFCTKERLEEMRKHQLENKKAPMYDRKCLNLTKKDKDELLKGKTPYVIRQKIPTEKIAKWNDLIHGNISFDGTNIDDQVLHKSDGYPTYHLANVIDDHLMEITHVIRGEEWLSSTPKHIWLYEAFGWKQPEFAHIPLLLNKDRTKLSKRQGDIAVEDYIKKGYLREAIINFIVFLGWHPGKAEVEEIYSLEELTQLFSLEKVHKAGAVVDFDKLNWVNWQWQKRKYEEKIKQGFSKEDALYEIAEKYLPPAWKSDLQYLKRTLISIEEKVLQEPQKIEQHLKFYFTEPEISLSLLLSEKMKVDKETAKKALETSFDALEKLTNYDDTNVKNTLNNVIQSLALKVGQVLWPIRVALTGEQFSPGAFEVIVSLGKERTLDRLQKTIKQLS